MEQQIQQQVKQLDDKVNRVDEKVNKVDGNVSQILMIMVGNTFDKDDKGIIGTVNNHGARLDKIEKYLFGINKTFLGIGIAMAILSGIGVREVISIIFK